MTFRVGPVGLSGLLASLLLAMTGCGAAPDDVASEELGTSEEAIKGGYADNASTNVVGIYDFAEGAICTGSLIAPNVVLTARHCVAPVKNDSTGVSCQITTFGTNGKASHFVVTTRQSMWDQSADHKVAEVLSPPVDSKFCGNDVAILILNENLDPAEAVPLTPRVDTELGKGEEYYAVGYGATVDDANGTGAGERRRRDHLFVDCVGGVDKACPSYAVKSTEWLGDTGICHGDSGGPAIDLQGRVVGVTSRGGADCTSPVYGYVHGWGQWIKDTVTYAAGLGGYPAPAWTTGYPTDPAYSFPVGDACSEPGQCASDRCINDGVGSYCTRLCNDQAPCPEGYTCDAQGLGVCFQVHEPARPHADEEPSEATETTGCTIGNRPGGDDPTKPVPWFTGAALAWALLRRRRAPRG